MYGRTRISARSFLEYPHVPPLGLSLAAVMYDAMAVRKRLLARKHTHAAHVAPEGDA